MKRKLKIIECADQLGLGGTEYALQLYCKYLDKDKFDVTAIGLFQGGERTRLIEELGVNVIVLNGDFIRLEKILKEVDVFHWHGSGELNTKLFESLTRVRPRMIIQTNVFGQYRPSKFYDIIDFDLYISRMILVRRMKTDGKTLTGAYAHKRKVLPYPVDIDHLTNPDIEPDKLAVKALKDSLQLGDSFVVGRIGRADDNKFDTITLTAFKEYLHFNPDARFLLIGATVRMREQIKRLGISKSVIILDNTPDLKLLLSYYKLMDVFLAASNIGESFGMVMAEAMCMGVPVVTISTPHKDNAQIEVVDNMITGISTYRLRHTIAAAINEISVNNQLKESMSSNSAKKVLDSYRAQDIVSSLEQLIFSSLQIDHKEQKSMILDWSQKLSIDYTQTCNQLYGTINFTDKLFLRYNQSIINRAVLKSVKILRSLKS